MASNIHLLASKQFFLTSQGLMGAGMSCRALLFTEIEDLDSINKVLSRKNLMLLANQI